MFGVVIIIDRLLPKVKFCIVSACVVFCWLFFCVCFLSFISQRTLFFFFTYVISLRNYLFSISFFYYEY